MRIVAGFAGSLVLSAPRSGTRPTSDRVREALFSALGSMDAVRGARVLDLYAGSGALALEAMSRGAATALLVEQSKQAAAVCRSNAAALLAARRAAAAGTSATGTVADAGSPIGVRVSSVQAFLAGAGGGVFDLVFLDPPYEVAEAELAEALTALGRLLSPDAVIVVERSARSPEPAWPAALELFRAKTYGETAVWFAQPALPSQSE